MPDIFDVVKQVYSTLSSDSTLTTQLGTFNSATAIFSGHEVPADVHIGGASLPYLWIRPDPVFTDFSSKPTKGLSITLSIAAVVRRTESAKELLDILSRVNTLLNHQDLTLTSDNFVMMKLLASSSLVETEELTGSILTYEIVVT